MQQEKSGRIIKSAWRAVLSFPHRIYVRYFRKSPRRTLTINQRADKEYKEISCAVYPATSIHMLTENMIRAELAEIEKEELENPTETGRLAISSEVENIELLTGLALQQYIRKNR